MTPLDQFVARWNAVDMVLPFIETENAQVDLNTMPDLWASAVFNSETRNDVSLGSLPWVEETGEIILVLLARSGQGRKVLDQAVAQVRQYFHGYVSPDEALWLPSARGPVNQGPEADGEWWHIAMSLPYKFQSRRIEPVAQVPDDPLVSAWLLEVIVKGGTCSPGRKALINETVVALRDAGLIDKMDRLWFSANEEIIASRIDVIALDNAQPIGEPVFTPDIGWTGSRTDADANTHLETSYQPDGSGKWQLDSAHVGIYIYNDRVGGDWNNAGSRGPTTGNSYVNCFAGDSIYASLNTDNNLSWPVPTPKGYTVVSLLGGNMALYKNGGQLIGGQPRTMIELYDAPWFLMAGPGLQYRSTDTHCVFHFGSGLTTGEVSDLSAIINGIYLTGIGANRYVTAPAQLPVLP